MVTPEALTLRASEFNSMDESSTPTARTPDEAARPFPAIAVTKSAILSFLELLSSASIIAMLSLATATSAAVSSFRSSARAEPAPPESPSPAAAAAILRVPSLCCSRPEPATSELIMLA